jgi:hypothetical protein
VFIEVLNNYRRSKAVLKHSNLIAYSLTLCFVACAFSQEKSVRIKKNGAWKKKLKLKISTNIGSLSLIGYLNSER